VARPLARRRLERPASAELHAAAELVAKHLDPTPLLEVCLDGRRIFLKLETDQPTGSFKVRGALAAVSGLEPGEPLVACSAGNHGLGIAWASGLLGARATVVVPETASAAKVEKLRRHDVELVLEGASYDEAEAAALELAAERGARYVSPYNDAEVIAGQATLGVELAAQRPGLEEVVVAVGGGGLAAGCALGLRAGTRLRGAQVAQNAAFAALARGQSHGPLLPTIADGIAGGLEERSVPLDILAGADFELRLVSEAQVHEALRLASSRFGIRIEGSAAAALAAALAEPTPADELCVVLSGANITDELFEAVLAGD
jgi:threonine dehydratase